MEMNKTVIFERSSFAKSKFMKRLHDPGDNGMMDSPILTNVDPVPWISYQNSTIPQTNQNNTSDGPDNVVYKPDHGMDYLFITYLCTQSPRVAVKNDMRGKVEICLPSNLFHHLIVSGDSRFGTINGPQIPHGWLDHQMSYYMKSGPGQESNYMRSIGNLRSLTEWNSVLPSVPLRCPQPWWFSESYTHAVPLFYCTNTPLAFHYTFNLQVLNLLRMRLRSEGKNNVDGWIYITDPVEKAKLLDNVDAKFSVPVMRGRYGRMDDRERKWKMEFSQSVLATSVIRKSTSNTITTGTSATISLDAATPIYAMHFAAQHVRAREIGNLSNYTTDPYERRYGYDAIKEVKHKYSDEVFEIQDLSDFTDMQSWYHATSSPRDVGYGMYCKSGYPNKILPDVGLIYDKDLAGAVEFQMVNASTRGGDISGDTSDDIYKDIISKYENGGERENQDRYYISLYLVTRFVITYSNDGGVQVDDGTKRVDESTIAASSRL